MLDVYPAREEPVGELAGVSGLDVARAAADRMGGRPVLWTPTLGAAQAALAGRLGAGRRAGHDRRRRRLQARRGAGRGRRRGMMRAAGRRRARLPARPPDHGPHRRCRRLVRAPRRRGEAARAARLGGRGGPGGRRRRLGLEPAGRRRGLPRPGPEARRRAGDGRARRRAAALRRRRPPALGRGEGRRLGPLRTRVRGQHPRHGGGAVKMNANAYGGQLAAVLEWVEVCTPSGSERRGPEELGFAYRRSNLGPRRGRRPRLLRPGGRRPRGGQGDAGLDARAAPRGAAVGDQDLRLDLQEPGGRARRRPHRGTAARGGRVPRPTGRWRPLLAEARQLRRERRRGDDRRRARR